jgi:hypothetical protein
MEEGADRRGGDCQEGASFSSSLSPLSLPLPRRGDLIEGRAKAKKDPPLAVSGAFHNRSIFDCGRVPGQKTGKAHRRI